MAFYVLLLISGLFFYRTYFCLIVSELILTFVEVMGKGIGGKVVFTYFMFINTTRKRAVGSLKSLVYTDLFFYPFKFIPISKCHLLHRRNLGSQSKSLSSSFKIKKVFFTLTEI